MPQQSLPVYVEPHPSSPEHAPEYFVNWRAVAIGSRAIKAMEKLRVAWPGFTYLAIDKPSKDLAKSRAGRRIMLDPPSRLMTAGRAILHGQHPYSDTTPILKPTLRADNIR